MGKEKFDRSKPHVNVGTIGHIDHGKDDVTAAITKVLQKHNPKKQFPLVRLDRQRAEERTAASPLPRRTWSMKRPTGTIAHVDCPGHADYIKNMINRRGADGPAQFW